MRPVLGNTRSNGHSSIENRFEDAHGQSDKGGVGKKAKSKTFSYLVQKTSVQLSGFPRGPPRRLGIFSTGIRTGKARAQIGRLR